MRSPELFSFIPAPGDWGQRYRLYGIMIAIGVIVGLELARRRWVARGGNPEDLGRLQDLLDRHEVRWVERSSAQPLGRVLYEDADQVVVVPG